MQPPVMRRLFGLSLFAEDREEERAMVQRAIFDGVIQLGDAARVELLLLDVAKVLKELLPALAEEPRLVATAPDE